jgi:hypothetical protein
VGEGRRTQEEVGEVHLHEVAGEEVVWEGEAGPEGGEGREARRVERGGVQDKGRSAGRGCMWEDICRLALSCEYGQESELSIVMQTASSDSSVRCLFHNSYSA